MPRWQRNIVYCVILFIIFPCFIIMTVWYGSYIMIDYILDRRIIFAIYIHNKMFRKFTLFINCALDITVYVKLTYLRLRIYSNINNEQSFVFTCSRTDKILASGILLSDQFYIYLRFNPWLSIHEKQGSV